MYTNLKPPSKGTLKKYGLSEADWYDMLRQQDGCCPVCEREFTEQLRPCVDHYHVKGFKKMSAEKKRKFVRGMLCLYCNQRLVPKGMTLERAYNIYEYLLDYEQRYNGD